MSYMLEFPRSNLPDNITSQPYAIFAIRGKPAQGADFPAMVPLAVMLHFAPKAERWLQQLSPSVKKGARSEVLLIPSVILNIQADITTDGLAFILNRMLQMAGLPLERGHFDVNPTIVQSLRVLQAWKALELPKAGTQGLETHLLMRLMLGPPVLASEIKALWDILPRTSPILVEMANNFVRSYKDDEYHPQERRLIVDWMSEGAEQRRFIKTFEDQYYRIREREQLIAIANANSAQPRVPSNPVVRAVPQTIRPRSRNVSLYSEEAEAKKEEARILRHIGSNSSMRAVQSVLCDLGKTTSGSGMP